MISRSWMAMLPVCAALAASSASAQEPAPSVPPTSVRELAPTSPGIPGTQEPPATPAPLLTPEQVQALVETVPPPPPAGSAEDQADVNAMLAAQKARTPEIEVECKRDEHFSARLFQGIYGPERTRENSPRFYALMRGVLAATDATNEAAKHKFHRPRPYQEHPGAIRALFQVSGYSYPSGHSMASYTLAMVLAELFPERAGVLLARAGQIAQSRVDAGVHYPSDIKEGEGLGKATAAALLATPIVQAELAGVKAELARRENAPD